MLQAQVNFWNLVEQRRHNEATELNAADVLAESIRHSMATEANERFKNEEIRRHDFASETLESISNRAKMLSSAAAQEQARVAAIRAGYDYEVGMGANAIAARNADTNALNASTRLQELDQRRSEMYAGMANTAIASLGRIGGSVAGQVAGNATRPEPKVQKIYRILD